MKKFKKAAALLLAAVLALALLTGCNASGEILAGILGSSSNQDPQAASVFVQRVNDARSSAGRAALTVDVGQGNSSAGLLLAYFQLYQGGRITPEEMYQFRNEMMETTTEDYRVTYINWYTMPTADFLSGNYYFTGTDNLATAEGSVIGVASSFDDQTANICIVIMKRY